MTWILLIIASNYGFRIEGYKSQTACMEAASIAGKSLWTDRVACIPAPEKSEH